MTISEFLDVSVETLEHMSTADLRRIAATGQRYSNKRITSLKEAKMTASTAYQALPQRVQKGGFKTENLSRNRLISAIGAEQRFLYSKNSTKAGWVKWQNKQYKDLGIKKADRTGKWGYNKYGKYVPLKPGEKSTLTRKQVDFYFELYRKAVQAGWLKESTSSDPVDNEQVADIIVQIVKANPTNKHVTSDMEKALDNALKELKYDQEDQQSTNAAEARAAGNRARFKKTSK